MKKIGSFIRGYLRFCFFGLIFLSVLSALVPQAESEGEMTYKKKSVKLTATTSSPNYYEFIRGKELLMTYTCKYRDGSSFGSISSVESVSPGTYSLMIERELENKRDPSMFDNDICSEPIDDFSKIEAVGVVVKITPQ